MRLRSFTTFAVAGAAMLFAYACSNDVPSSPTSHIAPPAEASNSLLGGLLGGSTTSTKIVPLLRNAPLSADIKVSKNIGALGGTISIPGAGLTVVVPPLALTTTKTITVTARKGSYVAYDFAPSGTKFLLPLVATQSLVNTQATSLVNLSLKLGYYPDPTRITSVTELLGVQLDLLKLTAISSIWHFSGYIYASGLETQDE
jgi:hypothetical protein